MSKLDPPTTRGLWCFDRQPTDVDCDWSKRNAFELKDYLQGADEGPGSEIRIVAFTLRQGQDPGKVWILGPSGKGSEIDGKLLEDLLRSVF
jgi:hypothetical protein